MATVIAIMGESGSGKTTSMRNLLPSETMYIDCDKKGLSWRGWKKQYNGESKNYIATSAVSTIQNALTKIDTSPNFAHIKFVIIDTLNGIMIDDEMERRKEKGYDKWQDMAASVYELIARTYTLRNDLTVIFTAHTQTERDDSGYQFTRIKTSGKKLEKIVPESKFTTVLHAKIIDGKHVFETKANNSTAKTPMGAFDELQIDNDITVVIDTLKKYESDED